MTRIALATSFWKFLRIHASSVGVGLEQRVLALRLAGLFRELIDRFDDLLDLFVREGDRFEEDLLGDLFARRLRPS